MFKKMLEYAGPCKRLTIQSGLVVLAVVLVSILPFVFVYQIITPLIMGSPIDPAHISLGILTVTICLVSHACLYVKELSMSREAAFHILMRLRVHLQKEMEMLPLGEIQGKGAGGLEHMFVNDVDSIEVPLVRALPEGFGNLAVSAAVYLCLFTVDWKLTLMSLAFPPVDLFPMCVISTIGSRDMGNYYTAEKVMNDTIIEHINSMGVVKVFNKGGGSYRLPSTANRPGTSQV